MDLEAACCCQGDHHPENGEVLSLFEVLRGDCPALRLLVPDDVWPEFAAWDKKGDHDAFHRSICLLALERGYLGRVTAPIHRFLLEEGRPRDDLRVQYLQDLRERWMLADDPLERHGRSRIFMGRIVELQCAAWLETEGWSVTGLEALRPGPDIEASLSGDRHAFEVKAIGRQDEDFISTLKSLRNEPALRWTSPYAAMNYLLFRAYEAASQLKQVLSRRAAIVVMEALAWHDFELQLKESWIDWSDPRFIGDDPEWEAFLDRQVVRYPELREELQTIVTGLDAIWIVQQQPGFEYRREMLIEPRAARHQTAGHSSVFGHSRGLGRRMSGCGPQRLGRRPVYSTGRGSGGS